ncbi:hypothetical protein DICSQDRAFT_70665 [Dichomitus squalens LYAD-421 SS1]|uniref:Uncharacterized protein n=1 Tax=Dichomitus squalens (strain LYAD-421) TaxID=732165 RepID=R7SL06_DICSQ|nr:uncharacterized protein DICSQDRAFT_70665 [Dichomitus squalens LYAD-421 SS1]EJF56819.1 hypothetical protein DICSQDRAFT_70665 [Dichomitus squalens LYAD-421 SS1]
MYLLAATIFAAALLIGLYSWFSSHERKDAGVTGRNSDFKEKGQTFVPGSSLPNPDPLVKFDIETATARNFVYANKTVRYPYYQTMAHQPMHVNHWIEIDKEYKWYLGEKARVIREQGKVVIDSLPDNDEACGELLLELVDYLPKRYPTLFTHEGPDGIVNLVTGEHHVSLGNRKGVDALLVVSRLVQDDFLMGREREDGKIYLVGGLIAFPGFYLLSETINKPLEVLHRPVPHFNEKLLMSVERTLKRFQPDQPFERSSWMIADDRNLFWHNIASAPPDPNIHPKDLWLRIDHQTFRKLPRTNAIIFGVHPIMRRIEDLADSPLVPTLLEKVHLETDDTLLTYKGTHKYHDILLPYLRELTESQVERGLIR